MEQGAGDDAELVELAGKRRVGDGEPTTKDESFSRSPEVVAGVRRRRRQI